MLVKFCGLSSVDDIKIAKDLRVEFLGFIVDSNSSDSLSVVGAKA